MEKTITLNSSKNKKFYWFSNLGYFLFFAINFMLLFFLVKKTSQNLKNPLNLHREESTDLVVARFEFNQPFLPLFIFYSLIHKGRLEGIFLFPTMLSALPFSETFLFRKSFDNEISDLLVSQKYTKIIEICEVELLKNPNNGEVIYYYEYARIKNGLHDRSVHEQALEHLGKAESYFGSDHKLYYHVIALKAAIKIYLNRCKEAIIDFDSIAKGVFNYQYIILNKAIGYLCLGQFDEALNQCIQAINLYPSDPRGYFVCGQAFYGKGDILDSIWHFDLAIKKDNTDSAQYTSRGIAKLCNNHTESALADFDKAIQLNKNFAEAYMFRAIILYGQKLLKAAEEDCDKATTLMRNQQRLLKTLYPNCVNSLLNSLSGTKVFGSDALMAKALYYYAKGDFTNGPSQVRKYCKLAIKEKKQLEGEAGYSIQLWRRFILFFEIYQNSIGMAIGLIILSFYKNRIIQVYENRYHYRIENIRKFAQRRRLAVEPQTTSFISYRWPQDQVACKQLSRQLIRLNHLMSSVINYHPLLDVANMGTRPIEFMAHILWAHIVFVVYTTDFISSVTINQEIHPDNNVVQYLNRLWDQDPDRTRLLQSRNRDDHRQLEQNLDLFFNGPGNHFNNIQKEQWMLMQRIRIMGINNVRVVPLCRDTFDPFPPNTSFINPPRNVNVGNQMMLTHINTMFWKWSNDREQIDSLLGIAGGANGQLRSQGIFVALLPQLDQDNDLRREYAQLVGQGPIHSAVTYWLDEIAERCFQRR